MIKLNATRDKHLGIFKFISNDIPVAAWPARWIYISQFHQSYCEDNKETIMLHLLLNSNNLSSEGFLCSCYTEASHK